MSLNSFGHMFRVTTWGESHGPALGATVDGCPPGVPIVAEAIQHWLDRRKPGQNKYTTQRREADDGARTLTLGERPPRSASATKSPTGNARWVATWPA